MRRLEKRALCGMMLVMLLASVAAFVSDVQIVGAESRTWTVDDDRPADFASIQEAINSPLVADGDTVFVYSGTYFESIELNKTVSLVGEDVSTTILNGGGAYAVVSVLANNSCVDGFRITAGVTGIDVGGYPERACGNFLVNNLITNVSCGIFVYDESSNNIVSMNIIEANGVGIWFYSSYNTIFGNSITGNDSYCGICCEPMEWGATNNNISRNRMRNCRYGIQLSSGGWGGLESNILEGNDIADCRYGIYVSGSSSNNVTGNLVSAIQEDGIVLDADGSGHYGYWPSTYNTVAENTITSGHCGISVSGSWNNKVVSNVAKENLCGIRLLWYRNWFNGEYFEDYYSHDNTIAQNYITANTLYAMELRNSSDNSIYKNNFIGNGEQVCTANSTNKWDNGYPSGGNYWSDYVDSDLFLSPSQDIAGSDGIWDHPYAIDEDNEDRYPLVNPWTSSPTERIHELTAAIETWNLPKGLTESLTSKLEGSLHLIEIGNEIATVHKLSSFMSHVEALRNKKLSSEQADYLLAEAQEIIDLVKE